MPFGVAKGIALALCWLLSCLGEAVATPYAVSVSRTNGNIVLSWPTEYLGRRLQQTFDLTPPRTWTDIPASVTTNRLSLSGTGTSRFFRLYTSLIPTNGLVARFDFNGNANDPVGGHNGLIHFAAPTSNRFGNSNSAYALNGTNAWIEIPDHDDLSIATTGEFSISIWINPYELTFPKSEGQCVYGDPHTNYVYWMGKGTDTGATGNQDEWACRMYDFYNCENRTNRISFYVFNPAGGQGAGSFVQDPVTPFVWIHFVATVDVAANQIKWYKNGVLRDTDALIDSNYNIVPQNGTAPVQLGTMNFNSYFAGAIDNLLFYNRVLSALEVTQLYQDQTP